MSFRIEIRDQAGQEFIESYLWYEAQRSGLGEEFHDEVHEHFTILLERPKSFAKWRGPYSRIILRRFPFLIVFRIVKNVVIIFSVFHVKRDPKRWGETP